MVTLPVADLAASVLRVLFTWLMRSVVVFWIAEKLGAVTTGLRGRAVSPMTWGGAALAEVEAGARPPSLAAGFAGSRPSGTSPPDSVEVEVEVEAVLVVDDDSDFGVSVAAAAEDSVAGAAEPPAAGASFLAVAVSPPPVAGALSLEAESFVEPPSSCWIDLESSEFEEIGRAGIGAAEPTLEVKVPAATRTGAGGGGAV